MMMNHDEIEEEWLIDKLEYRFKIYIKKLRYNSKHKSYNITFNSTIDYTNFRDYLTINSTSGELLTGSIAFEDALEIYII